MTAMLTIGRRRDQVVCQDPPRPGPLDWLGPEIDQLDGDPGLTFERAKGWPRHPRMCSSDEELCSGAFWGNSRGACSDFDVR
jgi:hypothetical protein